jgi:PAS domain S-box-containing protein
MVGEPPESIRVLHVDDDPQLADLTAEMLAREDGRFTVQTAPTADDGLDRLDETPFDCIISDYEMPGMDGIEFLETIREENPNLPFILYTGQGSEAIASNAITAGATDYLTKETGTQQYALLASKIQNAVEKYRSLQERQARATAMEASIDGVAILDDDGEYQFVNQAHAEIYGYDGPAAFLGETWRMCYSGDELERFEQSVMPTLREEASWRGEAIGTRKDGSTFPQALSLTHLDDGRIICIVRDISERKTAEHELERHRAFLQESMDIVAVLEPDGTFQYVTPSVERILGYTPDELVGRRAFELVHPDDRRSIQNRFTHLLEAPEVTPAPDGRFQTTDGDWRWLEVRATDQRENPAIEGIVINARDITVRKRREEALAELHDAATSLEEASTAADVYEILVDAADEILEFGVVVVSALEGDALVLKASTQTTDSEGFYEETALDADFLATRAFRRGETIVADDLRNYDVTPAKPEYRSALTVPIGDIGIFQSVSRQRDGFDETDRELAELLVDHGREALQRLAHEASLRERQKQLRRENDRLDRFASVVSHDLRNPLTVASGELELAREDCDSQHLEEVVTAHTRMESIISDVLTMARGGQTVEADELEWIDLERLSMECWRTVETADADLHIALEASVRADEDRLRHVCENLVRNAVEHAGETVTIRVGRLNENGFYIADDGPGISEHERDIVFESGYSGDDSGTGLGLAIVEEMVEAHDWDITLTESEDGGARFEITDVELRQ